MDKVEIQKIVNDLREGMGQAQARLTVAEREASELAQTYPEYLGDALVAVEKIEQEVFEFREEIRRFEQKLLPKKKKAGSEEWVDERLIQETWKEACREYFKTRLNEEEAKSLQELKVLRESEEKEKALAEMVNKVLGQEIRPKLYKPVHNRLQDTESWEEKQIKWAGRRALKAFGGNIKF